MTERIEPFEITFGPAAAAVHLLSQIANDPDILRIRPVFAQSAVRILDQWQASLATPEQIAMVDTDDELEIDGAGACVSEGADGFFIQTWTWVECDMSDEENEDA